MRMEDKGTHKMIYRLLALALACILVGMCGYARANDSMDEYALSIAPMLAMKTKATGYEWCGVIERTDSGYTVKLTTSMSARECRLRDVPRGATTIHSHPIFMGDTFGHGDYQTAGYLVKGTKVYHQAGRGTERRVSRK